MRKVIRKVTYEGPFEALAQQLQRSLPVGTTKYGDISITIEQREEIPEVCGVNLDDTSDYPDHIVPDMDVECCLKVLRTIRNACLDPATFDADGAVLLSHAYGKIVELVKECQEAENAQRKSATSSKAQDSQQATGDGGVE
jgi:hypothetical protein